VSREQDLIHDLEYIEDVLQGNRSYSFLNFKDSEFRRVMGDIRERVGDFWKETESKEDKKRELKQSISSALDAIDELNHIEDLIEEL
jgi:hypothetical protein